MTLPVVVFWLIIAHTGSIPFDSMSKCEDAARDMQAHHIAAQNETYCLEDTIDIPAIEFLR